MPYFKDQTNQLHFLDSADSVAMLPDGALEITDADAVVIMQSLLPAVAPNIAGFISDMKTAFGSIVAIASIPHYAVFMDALKLGEWDDASALLVDALANNMITAQQYEDFRAAFLANNIPVTLP